jgi:hypothetical protein
VSVGTGGYRSGYASSLFPVGESTTVGVAVSKTDFGKHGGGYDDSLRRRLWRLRLWPGYGSALDGAAATSQSVALSVMSAAAADGKSDTPDGCAPGFRDGGRYVEPLWVDGMRGGQTLRRGQAERL